MSELENFHAISLPSRCLPYDGVKPEDITARSYLGRDEIYLAEITPDNLDQKFLQIMKGAIRGIDPEQMTLGDREYFILWEYIRSYSDHLGFELVCLNCGKQIEIQVDLRELNVIELPENFKQPYSIPLPSGIDVQLRLLTIKDEIDANEFAQKSNEALIFRCARSVVEAGSIVDKMERLKSLPASDVATIRAFHEHFYHGPNMNTKFKCPKCGAEDDIEVPFRFEFIFPRGEALTRAFGKRIRP
jgi:hypothetical protein